MPQAFSADTRQLRKFERNLKQLTRNGLGYATRETVNGMAYRAQQEWRGEIRDSFTLRNRYTERSIEFDKTRSLEISQQEAVVGSIADYMRDQELGGTQSARRGKAYPIATDAARIAGSPSRLVSRPNRVKRIQLRDRRGGSQRQKNAAQIRLGKTKKTKYILLEKGEKRGIFKISGRKKTTIKLIQNLSHSSVRVKPEPTMQPAVLRAQASGGRLYKKALVRQLRRIFPRR